MQINNFIVSVVSIDDNLIKRVAEKCSSSPEEVKQYLQSSQQNDILLRAFLFYGVGPFNKFFESNIVKKDQKSEQIISMGCKVGKSYCQACDGVW